MEGFWSSCSRWFNEKTSSPLYFTYIAFFVAWNWKFFQVIFLESEILFNTPRVEYLENLKLHPFNILPLDWIVNFGWRVMPPLIFSYFAIVHFPKIHAWAFNIHVKNYFERKEMYRKEGLKYEKNKTEGLKEKAAEKKKQADQIQIIEKTQTEEDKWEEEYIENEKALDSSGFPILLNAIYDRKGRITDPASGHLIINKTALAFADSFGLIVFNESRNQVSLTEKGKYFAKNFLKTHRLY